MLVLVFTLGLVIGFLMTFQKRTLKQFWANLSGGYFAACAVIYTTSKKWSGQSLYFDLIELIATVIVVAIFYCGGVAIGKMVGRHFR